MVESEPPEQETATVFPLALMDVQQENGTVSEQPEQETAVNEYISKVRVTMDKLQSLVDSGCPVKAVEEAPKPNLDNTSMSNSLGVMKTAYVPKASSMSAPVAKAMPRRRVAEADHQDAPPAKK